MVEGNQSATERNKMLLLFEFAGQRVKRTMLSPTPSSQLAFDVGSVLVSAIKRVCKPVGAFSCIPEAKGEAGLP